MIGTEWADIDGKKQPWGTIAFDLSAIVSSVPIDDWKPTSEEYEGYTGNAGNTLDRWYHRSAIVLWHREHHFDVVASRGVASSIPLFRSMAAKLAKTPKKRLEAARGDCIRFARAIIARWPATRAGYRSSANEQHRSGGFPRALLMLHDRDTIALFLTKLAEQDPALRPEFLRRGRLPRVRLGCLCPGIEATALQAPPTRRANRKFRSATSSGSPPSAATSRRTRTSRRSPMTCVRLAVERFCEPRPPATDLLFVH